MSNGQKPRERLPLLKPWEPKGEVEVLSLSTIVGVAVGPGEYKEVRILGRAGFHMFGMDLRWSLRVGEPEWVLALIRVV
jgi:hypothetical protein